MNNISADESIKYFKDSTELVLHGRYNYVSTMRYLFSVCRSIYDSPEGTTIVSCCDKYAYCPWTDNTSFDKIIPGKLKDAIRYMTAASTPIVNPGGISWKKMRALRVLGMLMHVTGDIYAHKAKVPLRAINENVFNAQFDVGYTRSKLISEIQKGMMFNKVNQYFSNKNYEDAVDVYPVRFAAATKVSNNVLRYFATKQNDIAVDQVLKAGLEYDSFK